MAIEILNENSNKEDFLNHEGRTLAESAHKHVSPKRVNLLFCIHTEFWSLYIPIQETDNLE
jgi:hypothetical protein